MSETRWELNIGSRITATDGEAGRLQQVLVDPGQDRMVALVVQSGPLSERTVVMPVDQVTDATETEIMVRLNREQITALHDFYPWQSIELTEGQRGRLIKQASADRQAGGNNAFSTTLPVLAVRRGQVVFADNERVGHVALLLLTAQGQVRHFVLRRGTLRGRNLIVPVEWVRKVDEWNVYLSATRQRLEDLPDYVPDSALADEVDHALWSDALLRGSDYYAIDLTVSEGLAILEGHVTFSSLKTRAERIVRDVPGVLAIDNRLVADDDLSKWVAQALADDGHTRGQSVRVYAQHGFVYLEGEVRDAEIRDAAEQCAASLPQVRGVVNDLQAPDVIVAEADRRVWQPRSGQAVNTIDLPIGRVDKVIVDPRHRRVTAFVVHGLLPDPDHARSHTLSVNLPQRERRVVMPIAAVQAVTIGGVLLAIDSLEAARCEDFEAGRFCAPDADWRPPYPYRRADVLFTQECRNELEN